MNALRPTPLRPARAGRLFDLLWLSGALACGALLAWVDSSPGWDDTGLTVGLVLIGASAFGALKPAWAWAAALAVGAWIPVVEIPGSHDLGAMAALVFAFAGAYCGALARRLVSPREPTVPH